LALLVALLGAPRSYGHNGNTLVTIVDDVAPTSWSDSRGNYCPSGWEEIRGMLLCKHFSTFNRLSPDNQRALEDVRVVTVGLACPQTYQRLGDTLCTKFVTVSVADIYTLTADISYGGAYENGGEGTSATAPRCNPGWDLVSHPYEGGIGMCLRKVTALVQGPAAD
jgi:hypothetical protein